jgi:hypothetical protein
MKHRVLLIALLSLTACGKDSKKSAPQVPEPDNSVNTTTSEDKKPTDKQQCIGEACVPPVVPPSPPVTPATVDESKIPEGLVIFKAADHCVAKPSGAYAECKPIPRASVEVKFDLDKVSETTSKVVNSYLSFLSTIQYNYFCEGRQDDTFLVFAKTEIPIIHGTGEVTFSTSLQNDKKVELKRIAEGFSTVSSTCSIVITGRKTVLTDESMALLKHTYELADAEEKASLKSWLDREALRLKEVGFSDYDTLIESLPKTENKNTSSSL